jgi:hypothetical protein
MDLLADATAPSSPGMQECTQVVETARAAAGSVHLWDMLFLHRACEKLLTLKEGPLVTSILQAAAFFLLLCEQSSMSHQRWTNFNWLQLRTWS